MFFLLRSAICIGLVVAALPDNVGGARLADATASIPKAGDVARLASSGIADFCGKNPQTCLQLAGRIGHATSAVQQADKSSPKVPPSRDTLLAADLRSAWTGPASNPAE